MLKFFIKFNLTNSNADSLIDFGEIYANCAMYYIYSKKHRSVEGIGDEDEGALFGVVRAGVELPLFCMYEGGNKDLVRYNDKHYIRIDRRMIDYFANNERIDNKFFVIINSDCFLNRITSFQNYYDCRFDKVRYKKLSPDEQAELLIDKSAERLTIKSPEYSYQQEVRLIINDPFPTLSVDTNKELVCFANNSFKQYKGRTYVIGSLKGYAIKLNTKDLIEINENYIGLEYSLVKEIVEKMV